MENIVKLKLNTNLVTFFSGKYNTIWENAIDQELESDQLDKNEELSDDNYHSMSDILSAYQGIDIVGGLNISFIKEIEVTGFYQPKYYNYSTDILDFDIEIDKDGMLNALKILKDNKEFAKFLDDNYKSRDGFISYTPSKFNELFDEIDKEGDEYDQAVSALITFLVGQERLEAIELDAYYNCY